MAEPENDSRRALLLAIFNHLALPLKLPGKSDSKPQRIATALIQQAIDSVKAINKLCPSPHWEHVRRSLLKSSHVLGPNNLNEETLLKELRELLPDEFMVVHVNEQNASVMIFIDEKHEHVVFEIWEASATGQAVLASEDSLEWSFPGSSVSLPITDFQDDEFLKELAKFLDQAHHENVKLYGAVAFKAQTFVAESRDTAQPHLISRLLATIIGSLGTYVDPVLLTKHVRDDACWMDGAEHPWRRSPIWLSVRVAIQRRLYALLGDRIGRAHYKFFMTLTLTQLLDQVNGYLTQELVHGLKAKICSRMSKLEKEREFAAPNIKIEYDRLFKAVSPTILSVLRRVDSGIRTITNDWRQQQSRPLTLPKHPPRSAVILRLENSGDYLRSILNNPFMDYAAQSAIIANAPRQYRADDDVGMGFERFASQCYRIVDTQIQFVRNDLAQSLNSTEERCVARARNIIRYLADSPDAFEGGPVETSLFVLSVMEAWMRLDQDAIELYPLLKEFPTGFHLAMFEDLQLLFKSDMERLHVIEQYLRLREADISTRSSQLFDKISTECFAFRYVKETAAGQEIEALRLQIDSITEKKIKEKTEELDRGMDKYRELVKQQIAATCICEVQDGRRMNQHLCRKCSVGRDLERQQVRLLELALPKDDVQALSICFELRCPSAFAHYRDATWKILQRFGFRQTQLRSKVHMVLEKHPDLGKHGYVHSSISLASLKKSFMQTHYAWVKLPTTIADVIVPSGLHFEYYDTSSSIWPSRGLFAHSLETLAKPNISDTSSLARVVLQSFEDARAGKLTSNHILSTQSRCPKDVSLTEFMALQSLISRNFPRCLWTQILVELGQTAINFSSQSASVMISTITQRTGPRSSTPLRTTHAILATSDFGIRLLSKLQERLDSISHSTSEVNVLEMLIDIAIKLWSLTSSEHVKDGTSSLIEQIRTVCYQWIQMGSGQLQRCRELAMVQRLSRRTLRTALLTRKTFMIYDTIDNLGSDAAEQLVQAAIAIRRNIDRAVEQLPLYFKHAFRRDLEWSHGIRSELATLIGAHPGALLSAIRSIHPGFFASCSLGEVTFHRPWISGRLVAPQQTSFLQFNPVEGLLLVNNYPEGNLPREYQNHPILVELFDNRPLIAWRTPNFGMEWVLALHPWGQEVYLGSRPGIGLIVRIFGTAGIFELIPRTKFFRSLSYDLPGYLINKHFHWLQLNTRELHIRRALSKWETKPNSWILSLDTGMALRQDCTLIDPGSRIARQISDILTRLETGDHIVPYRGRYGKINVELPRMELRFRVNKHNRLESYQLQEEIDEDQDAGTLYGLKSKLVFRNIQNPHQRSVIVPFGIPRYRVRDEQPDVLIPPDGSGFAKFDIDPILGRLTCASEPRLLYFKVYLHALTTSVVPDPLTGRTGVEEAVYWLSSGCAIPWQPLGRAPLTILEALRKLSPYSEYYPTNLKRLRKAHWSSTLSIYAQDPRYRLLVDKLLEKSADIASLTGNIELAQDKEEQPTHQEDAHLHKRLLVRHQLHRRLAFDEEQLVTSKISSRWNSRDRPNTANILCRKVAKVVAAIVEWPSSMSTTTNLLVLVERTARLVDGTIAGFTTKEFDAILLSDRVDTHIVARDFGPLLQTCRGLGRQNKARLAFLLGSLAFNNKTDIDALLAALAFSMWPELHAISLPTWDVYTTFTPLHTPSRKDLADLVRPHCTIYEGESHLLSDYTHPKQRRAIEKAQRRHQEDVEKQCAGFAELLLKQWPSVDLSVNSSVVSGFPLIDIEAAVANVKPAWTQFLSCKDLTQYLEAVQTILSDRAMGSTHVITCDTSTLSNLGRNCYQGSQHAPPPMIQDLVQTPSSVWPIPVPMYSHSAVNKIPGTGQTHDKTAELGRILTILAATPSKTQNDFAMRMQASLHALKVKLRYQSESAVLVIPEDLDYQIQCGKADIDKHMAQIMSVLQTQEVSWSWLRMGGLLPVVTKIDMLQTLRLLDRLDFGAGARASIIHLAELLVRLQRLCRVRDAYRKGHETRLQDELDQLHSTNFDPQKNPNWLLFELDSNVTLRRAQVDVANATVFPSSGENSLHQLMMGQGKTSCILPVSALALADKKNLVRVVVPRALVLQTAQLLQHRLGALNGRPVMHVPFSRKTSTTIDQIRLLRKLHEEVLHNGGVIVTTPEHSLSLMLSGIQRTIDQRTEEAQELVSMHRWLQRVSRNILDESDLILDCKTQLIYPSGSLTAVDGHPNRWQVGQTLFKLVKSQLWFLQQKHPKGLQVFESARGFPFVYFLKKEAEDELIQRLAEELTAETSSVLPMNECTLEQRTVIRDFITLPGITSEIKKRLSQWNGETLKTIYLLRGLLVHRILLHVLKKRWNVQYGISENRAPIAVPFVAKGTPSENAEYGHCDVSILLTILAFYYGGVSKQQLQQVLEFVLRSDNAGSEYERITDSIALPERWRSLQAVNVKDDSHMEELHRHLRFSTIVCDLYLNHYIFPQHARQFDVKIAASGWDITGAQLSGDSNITTGFSGTIDNACLLPLTIVQQELDDFRHTNAEALVYLLEERNSSYQVLRFDGQRMSEEQLLQTLGRNGIRCLIDSGSYILELSNKEIAKRWLAIDSQAPAAVYFASDNRAMVEYRGGLSIPLVASPFADNTGDALVYFSNAHCRGSDLKLPPHTRGALTLGMYHTKDALVQSAMRLRLLPTTQSVTFFAPPEVHQAILDCLGKSERERLGSSDVIAWILRETCRSIEELQPLWHAQGLEYLNRTQALLDYPDFCVDTKHRESALKILCQHEKLQLEDLYGIRSKPGKVALSNKLVAIQNELKKRVSQFHDTGHAVHASALQEVEQEREVEQEVAHEQQVQRPRYHNPHRFDGLHRDLQSFAETGLISERSGAIEHYGSLLARTLIGKRYGVSRTMSRLYVTIAYGTTVNANPPSDNFIRPANWILWSDLQQLAILICPEEANLLIPMLGSVYLLSYSAPTTRNTIHFNDLTYCAIPPLPSGFRLPLWLKVELGIFAGKLFFTFEEYGMIKTLLGGDAKKRSPFGNKPLAFLQDWLALRRVDQDVLDTPMGYVIQGRDLAENHHFFRKDVATLTQLYAHVHDEEKQIEHDMDGGFDDQLDNDPDDYSDNDSEEQEQAEDSMLQESE